MAILGVLRQEEAYGYQILQQLGESSGLEATEATVYPILVRLARDGLLKVRAVPSPSGPPRRYYRLTAVGRSRLREMAAHWQRLKEAVDCLIAENP
jgi:PadR family transcriptional regulator PadR